MQNSSQIFGIFQTSLFLSFLSNYVLVKKGIKDIYTKLLNSVFKLYKALILKATDIIVSKQNLVIFDGSGTS